MDGIDLLQYVKKQHLNNPDSSVTEIYEDLFEEDAPFKRLFYWAEDSWDGVVLAIYEHIGRYPYYVCARGYFLSTPDFYPPEDYSYLFTEMLARGLTIYKHLDDIDITEYDHPELQQEFLRFLKRNGFPNARLKKGVDRGDEMHKLSPAWGFEDYVK